MGCWNGTCALTNLPILAGDPIVLYPLRATLAVEATMGGGYCYSTALAQPLTLPVRGVYNDYGGIENLRGASKEVQAFFEATLDLFVDSEGQPTEHSPSDLESFLNDGIERGDVFMRYRDKPLPLSFMMMHERAYDQIVMQRGNTARLTNGESFFDYHKNQVQILWQAEHANGIPWQLEFKGNVGALRHALLELVPLPQAFTERFVPKIEDNPVVREELIGMLVFAGAMQTMRKPWFFQCGAGSQDSDTSLHETLAEFTLAVARERHQEEEALHV